jgi:serine/threonine protein kinase
MKDDLTGQVINGAYHVEQLLADGGMSLVYLATQLSLSRLVVLKVLRPGFVDEDFINLFLREARINSQLNHPNVVNVVDFGKTEDNIVYLAMEYLDGHTLDEIVDDKHGLPFPQVLWVLEQLCAGIHAAHKLKVVHRDLKPNNVMISRLTGDTTVVKVLDFGISKPLSEEDLKHTRLGMIMGTPGFLAPEQIEGRLDIDPRADIYVIGALIYYMAAGKKPFSGASREIILSKQMGDGTPTLDPMEIVDPRCLKLQGIINKAMHSDREQRYPTVMALWDELIQLAHSQSASDADWEGAAESNVVTRYQFVFTGTTDEKTNIEQAKKNLTKEFSLTAAIADKLFCGKRVIVKKDLSDSEAKDLSDKFIGCGCPGFIEEVADATRIIKARSRPRTDRTEPGVIQPILINDRPGPAKRSTPTSSFNSQSAFTSGIKTGFGSGVTGTEAKALGNTKFRSRKLLASLVMTSFVLASLLLAIVPGVRYVFTDAWMEYIDGYQLPRGVSSHDINLGMSAAFTGAAKEIGRSMRIGIESYLQHVNESGGVHGRQIYLKAENDGYEPRLAQSNVTSMLADKAGVLAMLGNVGTPTAQVILPIALEKRMILFGTFSGASLLRNNPPDRYVFNYRASYQQETEALIHYFVSIKKVKPDRIGVFYQNDSYGKDGFSGVIKALQKYNVDYENIPAASYERNTSVVHDAANFFRNLATPLEAIIIVGTYSASAEFTIEMRNEGYKGELANVSFVGARALADKLREGDVRKGQGVIVSQVVPHYQSFATGVIEYRDALASYFPSDEPNFVSAEGYIAAKIFVEGLRRAGRYFTTESLVDEFKMMQGYDAGIGELVTFSGEDHQASNRVWGTILNSEGEFEALDLINVEL